MRIAVLDDWQEFGLTGSRAALIDIAGLMERGVTVCYTAGGPSVSSTAELALALMLAAARRIPAVENTLAFFDGKPIRVLDAAAH